MNKQKIKILEEELNIRVEDKIQTKLNLWLELFNEYNSHTNLISKNDMNFIFEKHIFDSLALTKYLDLNKNYTIVDVGTGGGFPSVILAIFFENLKITAVDSIGKKINFIKMVKERLNLQNLEVINDRIENIKPLNTDFIVTRAVGRILKIYDLSAKHLKEGGEFIFYKSSNYQGELDEFRKKHKKEVKIINYMLPTDERHKRCLISVF